MIDSINTHYVWCIWGWLSPFQGYHLFFPMIWSMDFPDELTPRGSCDAKQTRPHHFTMAERNSFSFIGFLDQAVSDLIEDGLEQRMVRKCSISSAPVCMQTDLYEIEKYLAVWSDEQFARLGCRAAGKRSKKQKVISPEEKDYRSNLLQVICYFRSTYEVLIDADEHLSNLMGPADLLTHLQELVHLPAGQLVPTLKYLVCWPMASWLRQEMPEQPDGLPLKVVKSPLNLFRGGRVSPRRHLRNLVSSRTSNRRALRVMWSWLQGAKRGLPEIPKEFILASKLKHAKALQKELPAIPEDFLADFQRDLKELWRGVCSTREMRFRDEEGIIRSGKIRKWKPDRPVRPWQGNPGWNACVQKSLGCGGKTEAIREVFSQKLSERLNAYVETNSAGSISVLPKVPMSTVASWAVEEIRDRPLSAKVEVCPEPMKARIITKGEALAYYAAMPLQKDSWRTLVAKEEFSLIGEPLSEQHLISIDQRTQELLKAVGLGATEFLLWVSGDYSAATDGLSLAISQLAMEEYLKARGIEPGDDLWMSLAVPHSPEHELHRLDIAWLCFVLDGQWTSWRVTSSLSSSFTTPSWTEWILRGLWDAHRCFTSSHQDHWWLSCACALHFLAIQLFHSDDVVILNTSLVQLFYFHSTFLLLSSTSFPSMSPRHEYTLNDTSTMPTVLSPCATSLQVYTQ